MNRSINRFNCYLRTSHSKVQVKLLSTAGTMENYQDTLSNATYYAIMLPLCLIITTCFNLWPYGSHIIVFTLQYMCTLQLLLVVDIDRLYFLTTGNSIFNLYYHTHKYWAFWNSGSPSKFWVSWLSAFILSNCSNCHSILPQRGIPHKLIQY